MDDSLQRLKAALADRYAVVGEIGSGGMATVYLADDLKHHRKVAVKVLRPDLVAVIGATRFLREIEIAAQLAHPHILPLHDSGEADGFLYYVMPFVEGESLRDRLERERALPMGELLRVLRDVADALAYAHQHGVVHRDIKPDNVMLTGRHALVTDFGVAKAVSEAGAGAQLTTVGVSLGTPAYMAPEQVSAEPDVDRRADLYAFGVLAYEMLAGRLPFVGASAHAVMVAHVTEQPQPVVELRADTPPALAAAVMRCLEKNRGDRFQSADELLVELEGLLTPAGGVTPVGTTPARARPTGRRLVLMAGIGVVLLLGGGWLVRDLRRSARVHWAREQAIPQIRAAADSAQWEEAWNLAQQVEEVAPDDPLLAAVWPLITRRVNIRTEPAGARVYRRAYAAADSTWHYLGTTPLDSVRVPMFGIYRGPEGLWYLRFEKDGFLPLEVLAIGFDGSYALNAVRGATGGMTCVPGGRMEELNLPGLEQLGGITLDTFWIDGLEVTNLHFKAFVDSGGYRRHELWTEPFVLDGRSLTWEAAMARFTDRTGRPGPSTWEAGDFPTGQGDYPVSGLSWYEAAAYAKFAGKSLPTIYHWARAAGPTAASWIIPRSNFDGRGPAPGGSYRGLGPFGTFDMAGNVREWCLNSAGASRYILGGGWNDPGYAFNDAYTQPPFDRSPTNGIRLVRYRPGDSTLAIASRPAVVAYRDFSRERPVADGIFQVYRRLYSYDRTPLNAVVESADSSAEDFVVQRVTFDAAYGRERVIAYLYLPRRGHPPYQTVVFFPGSDALNVRAFDPMQRARFFEYLLKSGRAVLYPIYKSTFERGDGFETDIANESSAYRDHVILWAKDFRRSVDFVETRADLDTSRLAYLGVSWGGVFGGLLPAVEPRVGAVLLYVAGLEFQRALPEVEPINFLPRITVPVLMLNGRYDHYFPVETSQRPFFRLLGTPPQRKRQVIAEGGHYVPRNQVIAETLGWLDRYLGPVR